MQVTPERYRRIAIASLVTLFAVIVAGAAVRLTNSGLGCDDWPNCNETSFVDVSSKHAAIEQVNRLFNGLVTVAVLLLAVLAHRVAPPRRGLVGLAWTLVVLVAANAVLGGISVRVDLHPIAIQGHLLLALAALVVNLVIVARCVSGRDPERVPSPTAVRLVWAVVTGTVAAIVAGTLVTGSGPHAGDETAPRLDFDIPSITRVHGVIVACTIAVALVLGSARRRSPRRSPGAARRPDALAGGRHRPGGDRLHPVLQRPARVAGWCACGRCGDRHAGDDASRLARRADPRRGLAVDGLLS